MLFEAHYNPLSVKIKYLCTYYLTTTLTNIRCVHRLHNKIRTLVSGENAATNRIVACDVRVIDASRYVSHESPPRMTTDCAKSGESSTVTTDMACVCPNARVYLCVCAHGRTKSVLACAGVHGRVGACVHVCACIRAREGTCVSVPESMHARVHAACNLLAHSRVPNARY